jgi:hypothetical protein
LTREGWRENPLLSFAAKREGSPPTTSAALVFRRRDRWRAALPFTLADHTTTNELAALGLSRKKGGKK